MKFSNTLPIQTGVIIFKTHFDSNLTCELDHRPFQNQNEWKSLLSEE